MADEPENDEFPEDEELQAFYTEDNQDALPRLADRVFDSDVLDRSHKRMYIDLMLSMREERRARPGFGTLHDLLIERTAFTFTLMKQREQHADAARMDFRNFERINKLFFMAVDRLFNEARIEDADQATRADAVTRSLKAALDAVDNLEIAPDIKAAFAENLRAEANALLTST